MGHVNIEEATEHTYNCRGECYYCRRLAREKKKEEFNMKIVFGWDEVSVLL